MKPGVLLLGGLDTSGGAGLAVDLRVAGAHKLRAFPVVTCLAIQSDYKLLELVPMSADVMIKQLKTIDRRSIGAIKIGALGSLNAWPAIIEILKGMAGIAIVLDPVWMSSSQGSLVADATPEDLKNFYREKLLPLCRILTPNYEEGLYLLGATGKPPMKDLAMQLGAELKCAILLKGGHVPEPQNPIIQDIFCSGNTVKPFQTLRIDKVKIRGTGCALATALACQLATQRETNAFQLEFAAKNALNFLGNAIKTAPKVDDGIFHLFP